MHTATDSVEITATTNSLWENTGKHPVLLNSGQSETSAGSRFRICREHLCMYWPVRCVLCLFCVCLCKPASEDFADPKNRCSDCDVHGSKKPRIWQGVHGRWIVVVCYCLWKWIGGSRIRGFFFAMFWVVPVPTPVLLCGTIRESTKTRKNTE